MATGAADLDADMANKLERAYRVGRRLGSDPNDAHTNDMQRARALFASLRNMTPGAWECLHDVAAAMEGSKRG